MRISRLFKRLRRWSSQAFRKRHSPAAFRTCRNAYNSALTAEGTTSKGTGNIICEVEFCIFYRLSLRTLRTKDVDTRVHIGRAVLTRRFRVLLWLISFRTCTHLLQTEQQMFYSKNVASDGTRFESQAKFFP
jgi:hypothetical protein